MRKTAVIYTRVSTAKQAADDLPIAGQVEQCRVKCEQLGADVLEVFTDAGISGRDEDRPGFQDAIHFCEAQRVDYFVTWSTSRFARDHVMAGFYKRRLEKRGVQLAYCTVEMGEKGSPGAFLLDGVYALFDELYSRQVAIDTTRSMMKNSRDGHWNGGRVPYGYRVVPSPKDPKRRSLSPCPEEAWIVGSIFRSRAAGAGPGVIAGQLNSSGFTHRGKPWRKNAVDHILHSPAAIGVYRFNRRTHGGSIKPESEWVSVPSHEPIIDRELWHQVAALNAAAPTRAERGSPASTHLFTGLLRCGDCSRPQHMETATGRHGVRYAYYNCSSWLASKQCRSQRRSATALDAWLVQIITDEVFTPEILREVAIELNSQCGDLARERRAKAKAIEAQLREINGRKAKLIDVLELQGRDAPNMADLASRLGELRSTAQALKVQYDELQRQEAPSFVVNDAQIAELREMLLDLVKDAADVSKGRALLQSLLDSIVISSERAEINYKTALLANGGRQLVAVHSEKNWLPE